MGKILFLTAHPDDETIFFGNSITKLSVAGQEVHVLCLTNGEKGFIHQELDDGRVVRVMRNGAKDLGHLRRAEFQKDCHILGASKAMTMNLPDGEVGAEHCLFIDKYIKGLAPDEVYTFDPTGTSVHPDHQACFFLSLHAALTSDPDAKLYFVQKPETLVRSMDEWSLTTMRQQDYLKPVTGSIENILLASKQYKDQAKLIGYFERIGFLTAPEQPCIAEPIWSDCLERVEFSEPRVRRLYMDGLEQYRNLMLEDSRG